MKFELNHGMCKLTKNVNVSVDHEIKNIYTILEILILNAIQSYENNTVINTIELNISESLDQLVFEVKDYGKGIADELKEDIFKKMITTKGENGSGLGLYISQILVKAKFNGEIWFESNLKGTSFFVSLPNHK